MKPEELFEGIAVIRTPRASERAAHLELTRAVTSPRQADASTLYVACKTAIANGRYGMELAYARGCRAFLCHTDAFPGEEAAVWIVDEPELLLGELAARLYGHPARQMTVLGITGSAGKTCVAAQTVQILRHFGRRVSSLTSDGLDLLGHCSYPDAVVPDAAYIQHALWQMAQAGSEIAVIELSAYQLAHFAAQAIPFTAVLLTNLMDRHTKGSVHQSFASYCEAKLSLLRAKSAFCILPNGIEVQRNTGVLRVGEAGDFWAENVSVQQQTAQAPHTRFTLCTKEEKSEIILPVMGDFAVNNALCTAALCRVVGLEATQIREGLRLALCRGRIECLSARFERLIYLDAAFLPQDLETVLCTLRPMCRGRLCVVMGSVGGRARARRAPLVRTAERFADHLYLTADDPDLEDPRAICEEMQRAMGEPLRADVLPDRRTAILRAVREMRPGDLVLILAKPYAKGQLVGGRFLPFDERECVAHALAEF